MFVVSGFNRCFHSSYCWYSSSSKSLLSELRKKTGYTFANCKKALEVNNNDLTQAEKWLKEQAKILGWAKATKLADRRTLQGLVSVLIDSSDKKSAAMVEINCETDFVAKNTLFQNITNTVAESCLSVAKNQTLFENGVAKITLETDKLKKLSNSTGKLLEDEVALLISQVGENILLKKAVCLKVDDTLSLAGTTHPTHPQSSNLLGKYGCLLIYSATSGDPAIESIAKQLSQHVIGMKPKKIGNVETDQPSENKDEEECMVHQEFLMEPETPVSSVLQEYGVEIKEFIRYECGEDSEPINNPAVAGDGGNNEEKMELKSVV